MYRPRVFTLTPNIVKDSYGKESEVLDLSLELEVVYRDLKREYLYREVVKSGYTDGTKTWETDSTKTQNYEWISNGVVEAREYGFRMCAFGECPGNPRFTW